MYSGFYIFLFTKHLFWFLNEKLSSILFAASFYLLAFNVLFGYVTWFIQILPYAAPSQYLYMMQNN